MIHQEDCWASDQDHTNMIINREEEGVIMELSGSMYDRMRRGGDGYDGGMYLMNKGSVVIFLMFLTLCQEIQKWQ